MGELRFPITAYVTNATVTEASGWLAKPVDLIVDVMGYFSTP